MYRSRRARKIGSKVSGQQWRCFGRQDGVYEAPRARSLDGTVAEGTMPVNRAWRRRMESITGVPNGGAFNVLSSEDMGLAKAWDQAQTDYIRSRGWNS